MAEPVHDDMPGRLTSEIRFRMHTRDALLLMRGQTHEADKVSGIMGLQDFGHRVTMIFRSAAADDPYADWALIRLEQLISETEAFLESSLAAAQKELAGNPDMEIPMVESIEPSLMRIISSTPYTAIVGRLFTKYDQFLRANLTCERAGLMDRDRANEARNQARRKLRRILSFPKDAWRYTGVTRYDVREGTERARQGEVVAQRMGIPPLPPKVVEGGLRGKHAPPIRRSQIDFSFLDGDEDEDDKGNKCEALTKSLNISSPPTKVAGGLSRGEHAPSACQPRPDFSFLDEEDGTEI